MKLVYIANARIPTEKAHGIQIMKMCEAFADSGVEVELVLPQRFNFIKDNPFKYYGIKKNFKIKKLPCFDLIPLVKYLGKLIFWIQSFSFACASFWYVLFKKADIIYSRDELPLFFLSFFKKNIVWEVHTARANFLAKRAAKKCKGIIAITQGLKDYYVKKYNLNSSKILVAPDGVDLEKFKVQNSKFKIREELGLPKDKKIIAYTGSFYLYDWKGVDIFLEAARYFEKDWLLLLVGGSKKEIREIKKKHTLENLFLVEHKPYFKIPYYLKASDVLVLPNSKKNEISEKYTSPMKLFEYMASGSPIVASNLPSICEVLNKNNAVLVEPDNPGALAEGIKKVLQNPDLADRISRQALEDVKNYTWQKRAERILDFIK